MKLVISFVSINSTNFQMKLGKLCTGCNTSKSYSEFYKNKNAHDKVNCYCKICSVQKYRDWRQARLEEVRKKDRVNRYKRTYGLSQEVAEALVENRQGICEICKLEDLLVVDHNHNTNQVRGFVCSSCNSALGYSRENIQTLKYMIKYLEKHHV